MSEQDKELKLLIMDACVLIDYIKAEPELFKTISSSIGKLHVVSVIYEEVDQIESPDQLAKYGINLIEPEIEDAFLAAQLDGGTSFQDNLCYLTAKRHGFTCVSNDKQLRSLCTQSYVPTLWGLELILTLVKAKGISGAKAKKIGTLIQQNNPKHITRKILKDFISKLTSI